VAMIAGGGAWLYALRRHGARVAGRAAARA
jgi:hypothetical protein